MCPDRRVTAKARCRRGLLPVRPGGRAGPDFRPGISCRRAIRAAARLCRDTASGQASASGAPVRAHPIPSPRRGTQGQRKHPLTPSRPAETTGNPEERRKGA
uniref:Uncharacterized protein n=1 Tax=Podoviridae sp. ctzMH52 TaxID=2826596 RepID=A0A8S5N2G8_9CAUD|nr:MAG TPA: hypothetical protein [Podoviridae sp. ctzMH52]